MDNNTIIPKLLNYKTLELHYGLKQSTMSKMVMRGEFVKPRLIGKKNYFLREDVEAWVLAL